MFIFMKVSSFCWPPKIRARPSLAVSQYQIGIIEATCWSLGEHYHVILELTMFRRYSVQSGRRIMRGNSMYRVPRVLPVLLFLCFNLNKVGHKNHWYFVYLMNAPVWQHPTSLSPPTVSIRQILRCLSRLLAIKSDILSNLMEINSYCLRPAGCWEQNEVSYYLETQILKKILPCAMPGAMRLSLRFVVMEPSPSEIQTDLNKNKTTNCRIGLSRNFTDYLSNLYKYEELFSCPDC